MSSPPINVEVNQCRKFIARAERRVADRDAQRGTEIVSLTEAQDRFPEAEQPSLPAVELGVQDWPNLPKWKERRSATSQTHDQRPWSQWQLCRLPVLVLASLSTSVAAGSPWRVLLVTEVRCRRKPFWLNGRFD